VKVVAADNDPSFLALSAPTTHGALSYRRSALACDVSRYWAREASSLPGARARVSNTRTESMRCFRSVRALILIVTELASMRVARNAAHCSAPAESSCLALLIMVVV
jgi:hypothetical protein